MAPASAEIVLPGLFQEEDHPGQEDPQGQEHPLTTTAAVTVLLEG